MIRRIVKLVVAVLVGYALYHFVPIYFSHHLFKDDLKQAALFGGGMSEAELLDQVLYQAQIRDIPLDRTNVTVRRVSGQTFIETWYEQPVRVLPWYTWVWQVEANADAMHIQGGGPRR